MYPAQKCIFFIVITAVVLWCAAFTLQPVLMKQDDSGKKLGALIYLGFSPTCHQYPERSFKLAGRPMAVCSRCAGIYYGGLLGILGYLLLRKIYRRIQASSKWLLLAGLPMLADVGCEKIGLFASGCLIHAFTGGIAGWIAGIYILLGIFDWIAVPSIYKKEVCNETW